MTSNTNSKRGEKDNIKGDTTRKLHKLQYVLKTENRKESKFIHGLEDIATRNIQQLIC